MRIQLRCNSCRVQRVSRETIGGWELDASHENGYVKQFFPSEYWRPYMEERWERVKVVVLQSGHLQFSDVFGNILVVHDVPKNFRAIEVYTTNSGTGVRFERRVS